MERSFFREKLQAEGIEALIPGDDDRIFVHDTVFDELGRGIVKPETKERYLTIIQDLASRGAEGIILGCTEIPLLIGPEDVSIPVFDTMIIHTDAIVAFALN
jgi:aspartate racemase